MAPGRRSLPAAALVTLALVAASSLAAADAPRFVFIGNLATVGLADFQQRKVIEVCAPASSLAGQTVTLHVTAEFSIELDPAVSGLIEYEVRDIKFGAYSDGICVSNLDARIDITNLDSPIDTTELQKKFEALQGHIEHSGTTNKIREDLPREMPAVGDVMRGIIDQGGLLPAFRIRLTYTLSGTADGDISQTVTFENTNPRPVDFASPGRGEAVSSLRPEFTWEMPRVPMDLPWIDGTLTIIDETSPGGHSWRSAHSVRITPPFRDMYTLPYPAGEDDLVPGHTYRQRVLLMDPAGKPVGSGAQSQGEEATFSVALERLEATEPDPADPLETLTPGLRWNDPNPAQVAAGFSAYRLEFGEGGSLGSNPWGVDVGASTSYEYAVPGRALIPGRTYAWRVVPLDRYRNPVEPGASEVSTFTLAELPEPTVTTLSAGTRLPGDQPVRLEVAPLPDWSPALAVEWYDNERLLGVGAPLEVSLAPGTHAVHAEVYVTGAPGNRRRGQPVAFEVFAALGEPAIQGLPAAFLFYQPPSVSVAPSGGVPPYTMSASLAGAGGGPVELAGSPTTVEAPGQSARWSLPTVAPGSYELAIEVTDAAGTGRRISHPVEAVVPRFALLVATADTGAPGPNFLSTQALRMRLQAVDPLSGAALDPAALPLRYSWQAGAEQMEGPAATAAGPLQVQAAELGAGQHTAQVTVSHAEFGEVATVSASLFVSAVDLAPQLTGLQERYLLGEPVQMTVSFAAGQPPYRVQLFDGEQLVAQEGPIRTTRASLTLEALGAGEHSLIARVQDAGQNAAASQPVAVTVGAPRLAALVLNDDHNLQRETVEPGEALTATITVDTAGAGGRASEPAGEFLARATRYRLVVEATGPRGQQTLSGPAYRFEPATLAAAGESVVVNARLELSGGAAAAAVSAGAGPAVIDQRQATVRLLEAVVPVDLALPGGARFELPAETPSATVGVELRVGRAGTYRGRVEAILLDGEAAAAPAPVAADLAPFTVGAAGLPGRLATDLALPRGRYQVTAQVEALQVAGIEAGQRFAAAPREVVVTRVRVGNGAVQMLQPQAGRYAEDQSIAFQATAVDPYGEDAAGRLTWTRQTGGGQAVEIGRGAGFSTPLPAGEHLITAYFTEAQERFEATTTVDVYEADVPSVAVLESVDARLAVLYRVAAGSEVRVEAPAIIQSGWNLSVRANPGIGTGPEAARIRFIPTPAVPALNVVEQAPSGSPIRRTVATEQVIGLRVGFVYSFEAGDEAAD